MVRADLMEKHFWNNKQESLPIRALNISLNFWIILIFWPKIRIFNSFQLDGIRKLAILAMRYFIAKNDTKKFNFICIHHNVSFTSKFIVFSGSKCVTCIIYSHVCIRVRHWVFTWMIWPIQQCRSCNLSYVFLSFQFHPIGTVDIIII